MNFKAPFIAYILLFPRSILSPSQANRHPGAQLQGKQIRMFAKQTGTGIHKFVADQTTNPKTRFWLRPKFLMTARLAQMHSGTVVVGDLAEMLRRLDKDSGLTALFTIQEMYPDLISARHLQSARSGSRIGTDLVGFLPKRSNRTKIHPTSNRTTSKPAGRKNPGAIATSRKGDILARQLGPKLGEILKIFPDAGPTQIANALNDMGIMSPMGGKWHPSSASNLLRRCRKLRVLAI